MRRSLAINLDFTQIHAHVDILLCSYSFHIRPIITNGDITGTNLNTNTAFFGPHFFAYINITISCSEIYIAAFSCNRCAYGDITIFSGKIYITILGDHRCAYVDCPCSGSHGNILRSSDIMPYVNITLRSFYTYGSCYIHICIKVYTSLFLQFSNQILFGLNTV